MAAIKIIYVAATQNKIQISDMYRFGGKRKRGFHIQINKRKVYVAYHSAFL